MNYLYLSCLITVCVMALVMLIVLVLNQLRPPTCGGYVDPNSRYCNEKGNIVNAQVPDSCDPNLPISYTENLIRFFEYITKTIQMAKKSRLIEILGETVPSSGKVYQGILLFAIPELLKILPSDFGQNYITPYGVISFYETMIPCIQDVDGLCRYLVGDTNLLENEICLDYFRAKQKQLQDQPCPFPVTDHNSRLLIQNVPFFNSIGLLGTFSLRLTQAVVVFNDLPVKDFPLNYWSYNVYLADNLDPNLTCSPYLQTNVASVVAPFHMFSCVAESNTKFNPLTGEGAVSPGHVRFYVIITINRKVGDYVRKQLEAQRDVIPFDCIHVFEIPAGEGSMPMDDRLPNPNALSRNDALFQPEYQRLCSFLRLSLSPEATDEDRSRLGDFIYHKHPYLDSFDVVLVDTGDLSPENVELVSSLHLPPHISPMTDELSLYAKDFDKMQRSLRSHLFWKGYAVKKLPTRFTTLNIFAPEYPKVRQTTIPYQGGWQAIQLGGNAQGDNYDAQYRTSKADCLADGDVMIALCVNHASLQNCIYNSINIVDINKAYGYDAVALDASFPQRYYVVLIGRNVELLNETETILRTHWKDQDVLFEKLFVRTGSSVDGNIPLCHQVIMVERIYMNLQYASVTDSTQLYQLTHLFGDNFRELQVETSNPDAWESLRNVTAPEVSTLIEPIYYKVSFSKQAIQKILLWVLFSLILIILLLATIWLIRSYGLQSFTKKRKRGQQRI